MSKEETESAEVQKTSTENGNMSMSDLHKEIEKAMDADEEKPTVADENSPKTDAPAATDGDGEGDATPETPAEETPAGEEDKGGEGGDADGDAPTIPDELVERAVKAGISLADTRTFTDPKVLERTIALVEKSAPKPDTTDGGSKEGSDEFSAESLPAELSEDEFDEGLVKAFNGMRSLVIEQGKLLAKYAKAWDSARAEQDAQAAAKAEAEAKAAAEAKKKAALEKRKSLALAKPGGESGAVPKKNYGDGDGEYADILAGLESKGLLQ